MRIGSTPEYNLSAFFLPSVVSAAFWQEIRWCSFGENKEFKEIKEIKEIREIREFKDTANMVLPIIPESP